MYRLLLASLVMLMGHPVLGMKRSAESPAPDAAQHRQDQERTNQLRQRQATLNANLIDAADWGDLTKIRHLLQRGAHANTTNRLGQTPLMLAAMGGYLEQCKALLACGADVHAQDPEGIPTLQYASHNGYDQICRLFLEHGADPDVRNAFGEPTLIDCIASSVNNPGEIYRCTKVLLEYGANADLTHHRHTPLMQAAYDGLFPVCELLLQYGTYHEDKIKKALIEAQLGQMDMEDENMGDENMDEENNSQFDAVIALLSDPEKIRAVLLRTDNPQLRKRFGKCTSIHQALQNRELGLPFEASRSRGRK